MKRNLWVLLLTLAVIAWGAIVVATTLPPAPMAKAQFFDNAGRPLSGGKIYTYEPGTTTPKATYTDSTGLVVNANPVILDSAGRGAIWLDGLYKFVVKDKNGYLIYTSDNVSSMPYSAPTPTQSFSQWQTIGLTPVYLSATSFSVTSDQTVTFSQGRRFKATVTGGTTYGTVMSSSYVGGVTTVSVAYDSLALNSGLSDMYIGILTPTNHSLPVQSTVTVTANYTVSNGDFGKTLVCAPSSTDITISLPTPTSVPNGVYLYTKNSTTYTVTISETIDGITPTLGQYNEIRIVNDGSAYHGKVVRSPDIIFPGFLSGETYSIIPSSNHVFTTATTTSDLFTLPSITVTEGDVFLVYGMSLVTLGTTANGMAGIQLFTSGTATVTLNGRVATSASPVQSEVIGVNQDIFLNASALGKVTASGQMVMQMAGYAEIDNQDFSGRTIYLMFLRKAE